MNVISRIVALVAFLLAAASAQADIIRDSTGYPANPEWVNGGHVMYSYINGGNYQVTGLVGLNLTQATSIDDLRGVMSGGSGFNWATSIVSIRINIHSSLAALAATPLVGNVYSATNVSIENLSGGVPSLMVGNANSFGWSNYWVDLGFTHFVLPAGNYIMSTVFHINSGFVGWTETLHDFGMPSDALAVFTLPGQVFDYRGLNGYTTGNAAVQITTHSVPEPGSLILLLGAALLGRRRRI
jgi:hypothetical protein